MPTLLSPTLLRDANRQDLWFQPFGFQLKIVTNSLAVVAAAATLFDAFGPAVVNDSPDFTFYLFELPDDGAPLTQPNFRIDGDQVWREMGPAARLVADRATGVAEGYFAKQVLDGQPFFRAHFLELAFFWRLAPRGMMGVHGAALAHNGRAVLLRAQSGGGKTTLAYAAARQRFQALAEDVVWLDWRRGCWWGTPWTFHLLPDAKQLFPELIDYQPVLQINGEVKLEVNLETIRPNSTTFCAQPGAVVLVERLPGGQSRLEPLDLAEARTHWLTGAAGNEIDFPDYDALLTSLLTDNTYRLYFGDDIDAAVDLLAPLWE
jgi:hypothetical protein